MIQRIQSLYLLFIAALMGVALFKPLAWFADDLCEFRLYAFSVRMPGDGTVQLTLCMGLLFAFACLLPFCTIFYFRRRLLQFRLCVVEAVLLVGAIIMESVYYFLCYRIFSESDPHAQGFGYAFALPFVCLVFVWLAARAILRDEALVRAADRIR